MQHELNVTYAAPEHCPELGRIMAESFRSAFADFISVKTLDENAVPENCAGLIGSILTEMGVLAGWVDGSPMGLLIFSEHPDGLTEIEAIHSLPESWGTGLGQPCWNLPWRRQTPGWARGSGHLRKMPGRDGFMRSTASPSPGRPGSANSTEPWRFDTKGNFYDRTDLGAGTKI